jgi:hypothetical protein
MKFLVVACCFLGGFASARAQNLLSNGDFTNEGAGWSGDITTPGDGFSRPPTAPVLVKLSADHATRVYERFRSSESDLNNLTFSLTCTPSSDCQFTGVGQVGKTASDMKPVVTFTPGPLGGRNPGSDEYHATFDNVTMMLLDPQSNMMEHTVLALNPAIAQPQTVTCRAFIMAAQHNESILYIAFPPGQGSVTLNKVSLVKGSPREVPPVNIPSTQNDNAITLEAWTGDTVAPDSAVGNDALLGGLGNDKDRNAVVVKLSPSRPAQINQKVKAPTGDLTLTLVCTPAAKVEVTTPSGDFPTIGDVVRRFADNLGAADAALPTPNSATPHKIIAVESKSTLLLRGVTLIVLDPEKPWYFAASNDLYIDLQKPIQQTTSYHFQFAKAHDEIVMLAFPAGHGTITVNHASLQQTPASPPPTP